MKSIACLLCVFALASSAFAKAPTVRIMIEGRGLRKPIEVLDPEILKASNVWFGSLIDESRPPVAAAPRGLGPYQLSFFADFGKGAQKVYVVFYHPNDGQAGYVYLPGEGDVWQDINWGSIMRRGRDGKWNYAAPQWEALIKPVLLRAAR